MNQKFNEVRLQDKHQEEVKEVGLSKGESKLQCTLSKDSKLFHKERLGCDSPAKLFALREKGLSFIQLHCPAIGYRPLLGKEPDLG